MAEKVTVRHNNLGSTSTNALSKVEIFLRNKYFQMIDDSQTFTPQNDTDRKKRQIRRLRRKLSPPWPKDKNLAILNWPKDLQPYCWRRGRTFHCEKKPTKKMTSLSRCKCKLIELARIWNNLPDDIQSYSE